MSSSNINIRVNSQLKKEAEELFKDLGLSMSSAINLFLKTSVNCDGIPFEISRKKPNSDTLAALLEVQEFEKHPEKYKTYSSFKEALEDLDTNEDISN